MVREARHPHNTIRNRRRMLKFHEARSIEDVAPKPRCSTKKCYPTRAEAANAVQEHLRRIICVGFAEYWCDLHQAWHVGHPYAKSKANRVFHECMLYFEDRIRRGV